MGVELVTLDGGASVLEYSAFWEFKGDHRGGRIVDAYSKFKIHSYVFSRDSTGPG